MTARSRKPAGSKQKAAAAAGQAFELWKIDDLIPYARNSRTHDEKQIAEIAGSLMEFGMVGAIVVRGGVIAKGHGTLAGIRKLYEAGHSLYSAPGKSSGASPYPDGMVPVINVSGWTEAQFRAYVIADNKLALNAGWDMEMLAAEMSELKALDFDLGVTGFDLDAINAMLGEPPPVTPPGSGSGEGTGQPGEQHSCPKCGHQWQDT